jgi:hypothetical protein
VQSEESNPVLPSLFRAVTSVEGFVLAVAGFYPFFFPHNALGKWPWISGPFNMRFIGAVYLTSLVAVMVVLAVPRWAPGRVALPMLVVFTNLVLLMSIIYIDRFDFSKGGTWAWFVLYVVIPASATYYWWRYRNLPPADQTAVPPAWRSYLLVAGVVMGLYGVGLLIAPRTLTDFWPWPIDAFHGRLYSAIFLTLAVAAFSVSRVAAPVELLLVGLTQITLGLFSILGLVLADISENTVNWSALGTWVWTAAFAVLLVAGAALVAQSQAGQARAAPSGASPAP